MQKSVSNPFLILSVELTFVSMDYLPFVDANNVCFRVVSTGCLEFLFGVVVLSFDGKSKKLAYVDSLF
jgi:hypothetical protein